MAIKISKERKYRYRWPRKPLFWNEGKTLCASIPFTWNMPKLKDLLKKKWRSDKNIKVIIGGPATKILPNFFEDLDFVKVEHTRDGVLQKINPMATKSSLSCIRACPFCAIGSLKIEGEKFVELNDWPDLPILIDNNILATSTVHFDKVIDRLKKHKWADFNSALDLRLLNEYHAERISEINDPLCRLAVDNPGMKELFDKGYNLLRSKGIPNNRMQVYCLTGFKTSPDEIWERCEWLAKYKVWVHPTWYHELDQLKYNIISDRQTKLGWDKVNKTHLFQHFWNQGLNRFAESFNNSMHNVY